MKFSAMFLFMSAQTCHQIASALFLNLNDFEGDKNSFDVFPHVDDCLKRVSHVEEIRKENFDGNFITDIKFEYLM